MISTTLNLEIAKLKYAPHYKTDKQTMNEFEMNEKASFLMKGNLDNAIVPYLLRGCKTTLGIQFGLMPPVKLNLPGERRFPFGVSQAVLAKRSATSLEKSNGIRTYYGTESLRLYLSPDNHPTASPLLVIGQLSICDAMENAYRKAIAPFAHLSTFLIGCCPALKDWTAARICRAFDSLPFPRGEKITAPLYRLIPFPEFQSPESKLGRNPEADEHYLSSVIHSIDKPASIPDGPNVYPFTDCYGTSSLHIVCLYDHPTRRKFYLPFMAYLQYGSSTPEMFGFLATKNIPWSENDLEGKDVVLCQEIDFAFQNKAAFLAIGKLLVTFPEPYGRYDLLDLKALNSAAKVTLLVANFEGETMAEACIASRSFAEVLNETLEDKSKFSVFMMSLQFTPIPDDVNSTQMLQKFMDEHKPLVIESILANSFEEFITVCDGYDQKRQRLIEAEESLNHFVDLSPIGEDNASVQGPLDRKERAKTEYLVHPIIPKGSHIELIAQEKTGKTNFAITLAYEIVTANQKSGLNGLIPGRFLTVAKSAARKVSYLDAELGKGVFDVKRDWVKGAYLPNKSRESAERDANFRYHDLKADGIPYAKRENHQHVLDLLAEDVKSGTPGPIGLVIIDTRRGFTMNQVGLEPQLTELIGKIRADFNCAVLVCHHMTMGSKDPAGNYSVTTAKTGMLKMYRDYIAADDNAKCKLYHPVKFELTAYSAYLPDVYSSPFYAKCEDGRWTLMEMDGEADGMNTKFKPVKCDEKAQLKALCADYKKYAKLTKTDVAEYLGTTDDTLSARIK